MDADGDTIPDAPVSQPVAVVAEEDFWSWVEGIGSAIRDAFVDTAEDTSSVKVPAASSGCGFIVGDWKPGEQPDANEDVDADGDSVPDQPDVEVSDDTPIPDADADADDAPDVPDDTPEVPEDAPEVPPDADADADDAPEIPEDAPDVPDVPDDGDVPEDGPVCTPITPTIYFTAPTNAEDFTLPDKTYAPSGVVQSGTILARSGMTCYHADVASGIYPDGAVPIWTPNPSPHPAGATTLRVDPDTTECAGGELNYF